MVLVNGTEQSSISISDRSAQYGDGSFTTVLIKQGKPLLWRLHLQRLQKNVQTFRISAPNWDDVTQQVYQQAKQYSDKGVVKVVISRGVGGRGYSPAGCVDTQVIISNFDWPKHYVEWQQDGIELGVCQQRLGLVPMLAGFKHLNRLEQVLLKQEVDDSGWLDAVVLDVNGHVMEATASNIFWRCENTVYTPELDMSGVHGVMRSHVLELLDSTDYCVEFVKTSLESLLCADEIFITNALMALVPIKKINENEFSERILLSALNKRLYTC
ncbi:aminodeoxychorismate lyase [Photobacterium profundum]|uniref:Aminodeoxychorismate lyase n=1 Tax=Photobacterium profundum 3TCK TaxID=314280 RepID=Q1Z0Z4_9GAMM|nr:aminodeoxychorismate lyase [Photobacterium profundum]EAS42125.1 4-amino-4-deoxychorismate lyase [Photobacterium profundum 3TCK]PSV64319.1 aminodeoxychorismate lyase [Photobacterium profundum]